MPVKTTNKYHDLARNKGWWNDCIDDLLLLHPSAVESKIPEKCCLIHSEVSEALETYRDKVMEPHLDDDNKPCGFASELADIMIRVYDLAGALGIDMDAAIEEKHQFNMTRPARHGGKTC